MHTRNVCARQVFTVMFTCVYPIFYFNQNVQMNMKFRIKPCSPYTIHIKVKVEIYDVLKHLQANVEGLTAPSTGHFCNKGTFAQGPCIGIDVLGY